MVPPAPRLCPSCKAALAPAQEFRCPTCGFSLSAGVILRDKPNETYGLEAISRKFGSRASFGAAALMAFVAWIYIDEISTAEQTGKTFFSDALTGAVYRVAGKWAVAAIWLALGVVFVLAGLRARKRARGK